MKTLLTIVAAAFIFTAASAQEKRASSAPQPVPMTSPAMKTQNTQNADQQNSQNSTAPKPTATTTETKKSDSKAESAPASIPPVDNKIAVSDPGAPGEKSNTKKATSQPADSKKATNSTGVSPK